MKISTLLLVLSCAVTIQAQNDGLQIAGSILNGLGQMFSGLGNIGQPPSGGQQQQGQPQTNPLMGLIQLVMKMFGGFLNPGPKPDISSTIPAFPKDSSASFPGGSSSFPVSSFPSGPQPTTPAPAASGSSGDFPGLGDFLTDA